MRLVPLAAESLGVRSMACLVQGSEASVLLDPGAALGPKRFGLPPSAAEDTALAEAKARIREAARDAQAFTVSHFHGDHFPRDGEEAMLQGKRVFMKDPLRRINPMQRRRGRNLLHVLRGRAEVVPAEGTSHQVGDLTLTFSEAVPHGPKGAGNGWVMMTAVRDRAGGCIVHTGDVMGPVEAATTEWVVEQAPDVVVLDGPAPYLGPERWPEALTERAESNLLRILLATDAKVLMDHHALRGPEVRGRFQEAYATGRVHSFAQHLGVDERLLEVARGGARKAGPTRANR